MHRLDDYLPSVLVVDDIPANLDVVVEHFRGEPLRLAVALSGEEALELVAADPPDLILVDIMMPGMDGYELCRRLKSDERSSDIPIIFLTAKGDVADEERGLALGAVDYITKPFSWPILKARVRNHLELKRKTDLLAKLAYLDGLTGVPNRRVFDEQLSLEWRRARRTGRQLALLMIDVDYFKAYNDRYGHGLGDDCLRAVAGTLNKLLHRPADLFARYGGEEFVALLPETNCEQARLIAEQFREGVADLSIPHEGSEAADHVTISIGCAARVPQRQESEQVLLKEADDHLYQAKREGRNRVR